MRLTARQARRELIIFVACVAAAVLLNVAAIISYGTRWVELMTQIGWELAIGLMLYLLVGLIRLAVRAVRRPRGIFQR